MESSSTADGTMDSAAPSTAAAAPALAHAQQLLSESRKLRVLLLSSDTGGGHRASAAALQAALQRLYGARVQVAVVDFWVQLARGPFRHFPAQYAFLARHPRLWKLTYELTRLAPLRALTEAYFNALAHRNVRAAFERFQPDLVLSVHPLVNTLALHVLDALAADTHVPRPPYVTVVTDLGGAHPTWFNRRADMTFVPIAAVAHLAQRAGLPDHKLHTVGLPVREQFWSAHREPKPQLRQRLRMLPHARAVLLVGGGDGVGGLHAVATTLARELPRAMRTSEHTSEQQVQLVVVCGNNSALRDKLQSRRFACHVTCLGYVSNMSEWMAACDLICTKAGPGTIAEALIRALPIIVTSFLPGQEEANVRYVTQQRVGVYARRPQRIAAIAAEWLSQPQLLADMSRRALQCATPHATLRLAEHIVRVARDRTAANVLEMQRRRQLRQLRKYTYLPHVPVLREDSAEWHVWVRVKLLLRVVTGALIVRRAATVAAAVHDSDNHHHQHGTRAQIADGGEGDAEARSCDNRDY